MAIHPATMLATAVLISGIQGFSAVTPSSVDAWEISNGTQVTATSGMRGGFDASAMFGVNTSIEPGRAVFADGLPDGFTHFVEWQTPDVVRLSRIQLFAGGDGPEYGNQREFEQFVLKGKKELTDSYTVIYSFIPPHPFTFLDINTAALLATDVPPTDAKYFRAEFVQWDAGTWFEGPRVIELDGFVTPTVPQIAQSTNDLWDVSKGSVVTASSGMFPGFHESDAFGTTLSSDEAVAIFADGYPNGTTHFMEWKTKSPISLTSFNVFAAGDGAIYLHQREFSKFVLKAKRHETNAFETIYTFSATHPYTSLDESNGALISATIPATEAQFFRAEFEQWNAGRGYDGPRVIEMDGYGTVLPVSIPISTNDLWDVSQGASVVQSSPVRGGFFASDALGTRKSANSGVLIFADGLPNEYTHFIEWTSATPILLNGFNVFAVGDGATFLHQREFSRFILKAKRDSSDTYTTIYTFDPELPSVQLDPITGAMLSVTIPPVEAQYFRAEFVQRNVGTGFDGPRVIELDAIATALPPANLGVADWTFEEGAIGQPATNIVDFSGSENHAIPVNSPLYAEGSGADSQAVALDLSGGAHFRHSSSNFNFGSGDFTLEAILMPDPAVGGTNRAIVAAHNPQNGGLIFLLDYRPATRLASFSLVTSNGFRQYVSVRIPNDGNSHHIGAVRRGANLAIYLDKNLSQEKSAFMTPNVPVNGPVDLFVGATAAGNFFEGSLDRVRVSKGALAPAAFIEFLSPPFAILDHPRSQTVTAGADATFAVFVAGSVTNTFQWFHNGSPISDSTNKVLVLTNVQPVDAGQYFVAVSGAGRTINSDAATLTVTVPPPGGPSKTDLFDIASGNVVVRHSGMFPSISAAAMFGDQSPSMEPGSTIFSDSYTNGFTHFIEWKTASPIVLRRLKLFAGGDAPEYFYEREFDSFVIRARTSPSSGFDRVIYSYTPTHPYTFLDFNIALLLDVELAEPVTAQEFRAEFVQWNAGRGYDGPRVLELDGFGDRLAPVSQTVADWDFENGVPGQTITSVPDVTGKGHDITQYIGNPTFSSTDAQTAGAVSANFPPGGSAFGSALRPADSIDFNLGSQFTIEVSIDPGSENPTWNRGVVVGQDATSGRLVYALDYRSEQRTISFVVVDEHGAGEKVSANIPDDGTSHHVAGVYDAGTLRIYLDKVLVTTLQTTLTPGIAPGGAARVTLGANDIGGYWFHGILDRVRITRDALTPEEFFQQRRDVNTPVTIVQPLQDITVDEGGTATFQVAATGPGALSYVWFHNDVQLIGQSSNVLVLHNVQQTNAGTYKVTVASGPWEATDTATLSVTNAVPTAPVITDPVTNVTQGVFVGGTAQFGVSAIGTPPLYYQWKFNDEILVGATASTLTLSNVTTNNAGYYSVVVSNNFGQANSQPMLLAVLPADPIPPVITITSPVAGQTSSNRVDLAGTVTDNQQWFRAEWLRDGQLVGPLFVFPSGGFHIPNLILHSGTNTFTVRAFDFAGNISSESVSVILNYQRSISIGTSAPVQEGARVSFPILVTSSGEIGALSFVLNYDTNYLTRPELDWKNRELGAFTQVNIDTPGAIHATYVLPGRTFRAGEDEELATVTFRTRSVPESLSTPITLSHPGVYSALGDPITSGTSVESGEVQITRREYIGDNNANDRLDVGDATAIIRMLTLLDPIRAWDVTGNDLNTNASLDAGDIVRVLRAVVNLDPQPGEHHGRLGAMAVSADASTARATVTADRARLTAGQQVRVQVNVSGLTVPLSGAAFRLDYPTTALRLESAASHSTGSLIPQDAIAMWNLVPGQDYAAQSGTIHFVASTATPWSANSGTVAELTFTVLEGAASKYAWPVRVNAEAGSITDVIPLASGDLILTGRDAQSAEFNAAALNANGDFELRLVGEADVRYRVESSTNLLEWTEVGVFTSASGAILVSDPAASGHKFYRAIQLD